MKEYRKIQNIFKFDPTYKKILGLNEPYQTLKDIKWIGTEKVDGTNIRIHWDGHEISFKGRTDNAQFQGGLEKYLTDTFLTQEMEYLFEQVFGDKETIVFGEGYGPKVQKNGELYSSELGFIVFDVTIDGYQLEIDDVKDVATQLGLSSVPILFEGTLDEAIELVKKHCSSVLNMNHELEGLVLSPEVPIYGSHGNRIKCKLKYRDMLKGGLIDNE